MGKMVLAGIFTLAASASLAQTDAAPGTAQEPPASEQAGAGAGGPANLCQELLAFMTAPPEEAAAAAAPAAPAQAGSAKADGKEAAPASGEARPPQAVEKTQSAQEASGQTGPAHEAPEPNAKPAEDGQAQKAEQTSGLSAPVPAEPPSTPKDSVMSLAEAEELASAGDIAACQNAARELRLAGVAVPPPLLALTALDLKYQRTAEPPSQAPEAEVPAAGARDAAPEPETPAPQTQSD